MKPLQNLKTFTGAFLISLILIGCSKENEPVQIPKSVNGKISKRDLTPSGNITETSQGYMVDGSLTLGTEASGDVVFSNADLDVQFNDDGSLKSVSGTSEVPAPSNYFEFENPIQADIGFFSGKFLNENRDFEIQLVDDRYYFVFAISVNIEMKVGANNDPEAQKPLSIKAPVGGHITFIADYTDPMFFYSLGGDALGSNSEGSNTTGGNSSSSKLGSVSFGASFESNFTYISSNPVNGKTVTFEANQVTGGTVSFFKMLEATGMYYQNRGFDINANFDSPMESDFGYHYKAGINGTLDFSLDITSFISFGFPIGSGSAAIVAEANTNDGVTAKALINGLVEPDLSWWPNFIPIAPNGNMNAYGYLDQTGDFDIGLTGVFNLETPTGNQSIGGSIRATPEAFTMAGQVTIDDDVWEANATFTKDETVVIATPPNNFTDGISETVTAQIDAAIETTQKAMDDLEAANKQYEFELSLRGLRAALPDIIDRANTEITNAENSAISAAESQASSIASSNDAAICSTNISSVVRTAVKPYKDALNRLKSAVNDTNDNDQTRVELEAALRYLATLDKINKTVTVSITYGNKAVNNPSPFPDVSKCSVWSRSTTRNRTISATILTTDQVSQILEAADNVQYIAEAEGIKFDAQTVLNQLPTLDELEVIKNGAESCINDLTAGLESSGFRYDNNTKAFSPFIIVNGEEKSVKPYDIFSKNEFIEQARVNTTSCNPNDALQNLINDAQQRI